MPGFYTAKFSTIRIFMPLRMRRKVRRLVRSEKRIGKHEVTRLQKLIVEHYVTKSSKGIEKFINNFERDLNASYKVLLYEDFQESKAIEIMARIENILLHMGENRKQIEEVIKKSGIKEDERKAYEELLKFEDILKRELARSIWRGSKIEHKDYIELLNAIAQVDVKKPKETLMDELKVAARNMQVSTLARYPFYRDIGKERTDIRLLEMVSKKLEKVEHFIIGKKYKNARKDCVELVGLFTKQQNPLYDVFLRAHYIKHRDFIFTFMALSDEEFLQAIIEDDVVKHWYPELKGKSQEEKLIRAKEKFREHLQTIAQAERIFYHKEVELFKKAK